ncbi:MAG: radical SAM protein [Lachnospiraceae bacterium]|nr:radical SAM protein [Lachnospiraceae bacterium]
MQLSFTEQTAYSNCRLCPRQCGVDRTVGETGFCGMGIYPVVARAALHFWEEPCISGEAGSGAVFFAGCNLRCVFCQNQEISRGQAGKEISVERLAEICLELQEKGANNINLVTATMFIPSVAEALRQAKEKGLQIPVVYNCGGYESVEALRLLDGLVDIYLPDFKYWESEIARDYSAAEDYCMHAKEALAEMVRQAGAPQFNEKGILLKGVVVRHLLLPGQRKDAEKIIDYLYQTYGNDIYISIMNQYTPMADMDVTDKVLYKDLGRKVTRFEYDKTIEFALDLGVKNGFMQEGGTVGESFIPAFDLEGVEHE